ncbi:MAG: hypothetical protein RLZ98_2906 [Pseudomonadota bacterium]|jgi:RNA polymerase sigma-70 factor (ECF subfamily)
MRHQDGISSGPPTPEQLIAAVASEQDKQAFETLFDSFAPRVKAFLIRQGLTAERAEELTQETFITVWRKAPLFQASKGNAVTWIYTIARNMRIDDARRDKRAQLYEVMEEFEPDEPPRPDDIVSGEERAERVRTAMQDLPAEQFEVVQLSFVEGAAHGEIASRLGLPLGTVKSRLRLAMRRLRRSLEDLA